MTAPLRFVVRYYLWKVAQLLAELFPFKWAMPAYVYVLKKKEALQEDLLSYEESHR